MDQNEVSRVVSARLSGELSYLECIFCHSKFIESYSITRRKDKVLWWIRCTYCNAQWVENFSFCDIRIVLEKDGISVDSSKVIGFD